MWTQKVVWSVGAIYKEWTAQYQLRENIVKSLGGNSARDNMRGDQIRHETLH